MHVRIAIAGLLVVVSHATAGTLAKPACDASTTPTTTKSPRTLRDVDWCNFDYGGGLRGPLKNGRSELHEYEDMGQPHDTILTRLAGLTYGDLDGDGTVEAAVAIATSAYFARSGRESHSTTIHVYRLVRGTPTKLGSIPSGTPVSSITFGTRTLTVTSGTPATTTRYRHAKDTFTAIVDGKR